MAAENKVREELKRAYPSKEWAKKVDKMNSAQVTAVYMRLRSQGKI